MKKILDKDSFELSEESSGPRGGRYGGGGWRCRGAVSLASRSAGVLLLIRSGGRAGNNNCSSFIGSLVHARRPGGGRVGGQRASAALSFRLTRMRTAAQPCIRVRRAGAASSVSAWQLRRGGGSNSAVSRGCIVEGCVRGYVLRGLPPGSEARGRSLQPREVATQRASCVRRLPPPLSR